MALRAIHVGNDADDDLHLITAILALLFGTGLLRAFRGRQAPLPRRRLRQDSGRASAQAGRGEPALVLVP